MNDTYYANLLRLLGVPNEAERSVEDLTAFFQLMNNKAATNTDGLAHFHQAHLATYIFERWAVDMKPTDRVRLTIDRERKMLSLSSQETNWFLEFELVGPDHNPVVAAQQSFFAVQLPMTRQQFMEVLHTGGHYTLTSESLFAIGEFLGKYPSRGLNDIVCRQVGNYLAIRTTVHEQFLVLFAFQQPNTERRLLTTQPLEALPLPRSHRFPTEEQFVWLKERSVLFAAKGYPDIDPAMLPLVKRVEARDNMTVVYSREGTAYGHGKCFGLMIACRDDKAQDDLLEATCQMLAYLEHNKGMQNGHARHILREFHVAMNYKLMPAEHNVTPGMLPLNRPKREMYPVMSLLYTAANQHTKDLFFDVLKGLFLPVDNLGRPVPV